MKIVVLLLLFPTSQTDSPVLTEEGKMKVVAAYLLAVLGVRAALLFFWHYIPYGRYGENWACNYQANSYKVNFMKYTIFISSILSNFASFILHFSFLIKLIGIRSNGELNSTHLLASRYVLMKV
jgi:hypothetical protein